MGLSSELRGAARRCRESPRISRRRVSSPYVGAHLLGGVVIKRALFFFFNIITFFFLIPILWAVSPCTRFSPPCDSRPEGGMVTRAPWGEHVGRQGSRAREHRWCCAVEMHRSTTAFLRFPAELPAAGARCRAAALRGRPRLSLPYITAPAGPVLPAPRQRQRQHRPRHSPTAASPPADARGVLHPDVSPHFGDRVDLQL